MKPEFPKHLLTAKRVKSAVLSVGDGRGFCVKAQGERIVVTAAHCLPSFPPCHLQERTYPKLLAPLGSEPTVWAECLFADPIADIAVLGSPDSQGLFEQAENYEALVESVTPLKIADCPPEKGRAWLLSLDKKWVECAVEVINDGSILIWDEAQSIAGGMSGSPIISDSGAAIGGVCLGGSRSPSENPRLVRDLPSRFLRPNRKRLPT
jgi:hypothetical protein